MSALEQYGTPVTGSQQYREVLAQTSDERVKGVLSSREETQKYVSELIDGYRFLAAIEGKAKGQKAYHGAYIYHLLSTLAVKGRVDGVALGEVVGKALGEWHGDRDENGEPIVTPLGSGSVSRYKYIAKLHFEAGFTPDDPEWSYLVNYGVSKPALTSYLKQRDVKADPAKVREIHARMTAPAVKAIAPTPTPSGEGSQGPENGEPETPEDTPDTTPETPVAETLEVPTPEAPTGREAQPTQFDLPRTTSGKIDAALAALAGVDADTVSDEDRNTLVVIVEHVSRLMGGVTITVG